MQRARLEGPAEGGSFAIQAIEGRLREAGIWDCLRRGRADEARARAQRWGFAPSTSMACDSGSWLLASELSLEPPPTHA